MLETLTEIASQAERADMVDSTVNRPYQCAVGIKRDSKSRSARPLARRLPLRACHDKTCACKISALLKTVTESVPLVKV